MANTTGYGYLLGPAPQFFDANGKPLVGGKLFIYIAGTTTKAVTYSDFFQTENTNPVVLNDLGTCMLIVPSANLYKIVLYDRKGNLLITRDNVSVSPKQQIIYTAANKVESSDSTVDVTATTDTDTGIITYDLSIKGEIDRATEAEKGLADSIEAEKKRAESAESSLSKSIADKAGTASPLMDGNASVGNSLKYAREDHVHPTDTSREDKANKTTVVLGTSNSKYPTDKAVAEFVNSSIATNTANYISNNGEPFTSLEQLNAYSGTVTNNDYAFVTGIDSEGNTYYDRYKATVSGETVTWALEYRLNNSSFTAAQWSAINSGITSALVSKIHTHSNKDVLDGITSSDVANWNSKQNSLTFDVEPTAGSKNPVTSDGIKTELDAKANGDNSVAILDGYMRRMNESTGWRRLAYKQFNSTNSNVNALFRLYLIGSNNDHVGLGELIVNIRFGADGSAPYLNNCYLLSYKPLNTLVKVKVIGVAGNAVVELWFRPLTFSMLMLTCLGNGQDVVPNTKDWTFRRYFSATDPEPVEDIANNIYVFSVTVKRVQLNIASPTNNNLVAMDANGLVKDSGLAKSSVESAISKAGSAIQGVKVNGTTLTPDANKIVTVPLVTTSADGTMSAADKTKLDGIAAGTASPLMDGKASVGNSLKYAREDHVHPTDTSREDIANKTTVVLGTSDSKYPTDKAVAEFVNSSIATNSSNYISNNGEPFTSVAQLEAYSGPVKNNDYAFVTGIDSEGNTYYDRYKATVSGETVTWALEYRLNNSSFTSAQWSAINSGITSALVAKIHTHSNKDVLDGITSDKVNSWDGKEDAFDVLPTTKGGTGTNAANKSALTSTLINSLSSETSTPKDNDYYVSQHEGGGTSNTTYVRRPVSALWNYIKGKISSVLGLTESNYSGKAATAGTADKAVADNSGNNIEETYATKTELSTHTHGNIQNGGTLQTNDITIANGDKLVVTDTSDSNKVARASLTFDGATTNQMLSKKGEWSDTIAKARAVLDYSSPSNASPSNAIEIGYAGGSVTAPKFFAVYTSSNNGYKTAIKDCQVSTVKKLINGTSVGSTAVPVFINADGETQVCTDDFVHDGDVTSTYSSTGTAPVNGTAVSAAIEGLDVSSVGGDGKYISAISETDGKISATATTMDTTPTAGSTNPVTSEGIKTALEVLQSNIDTVDAKGIVINEINGENVICFE